MDWHGKSIRMGTWVVVLAIVLRLWGSGALELGLSALKSPQVASFLLYLETGRVFRPVSDPSEPTQLTPETEPAQVAFSPEDQELVYIRGTSEEVIDAAALLQMPLTWDLTGENPAVLILHTHATESYTPSPGENYMETTDYRTLDKAYNMVSLGDHLAALLEKAGIRVIHAEELHDYPNYDGSYGRSYETATRILAENPSIRLVLDLHRDAAVNPDGSQYATHARVDGQDAAQIMFLMGTQQEHWQENMALATKLTVWMEQQYPGSTRGILTRTSDYNQRLSPGALLVEVGSAGNTHAEALKAVEVLARAIIALARGTV